MRRPQFSEGHFYHVFNRGVEKRTIFQDDADYLRFIHDLFEFNDTAPAGRFSHPHSEIRSPNIRKPRDIIVRIHCFCLMPNHYHLLLEQVRPAGISQFMKKLGIGYAMYFNERYGRVGTLFQGKFKAVLIEDDTYYTHLSRYIHLNPMELIEPHWKNRGIQDWRKAKAFLESYRWSSYSDYIGKKNFPSVTARKFLYSLFSSPTRPPAFEYQQFVRQWLARDLPGIESLMLE